jgi:hypothetical protein
MWYIDAGWARPMPLQGRILRAYASTLHHACKGLLLRWKLTIGLQTDMSAA